MLACAIPGFQLSSEEKKCCDAMGGDCRQNTQAMPASHTCCDTVVRTPDDALRVRSLTLSVPLLNPDALNVLSVDLHIKILSEPNFLGLNMHGPPGQSVDTSAPLRI